MKLKSISFTGAWYVVEHDLRTAGEWNHEYAPEPDEWTICFMDTGLYGEIIRNPVEITRGKWSVDENGIISIRYESEAVGKCVFREEGRGSYLYLYDDLLHIAPDPAVIVKHHAYSRYRLERMAATAADKMKSER